MIEGSVMKVPTATYLTSCLPGLGGAIKHCPEDFCVEELPLTVACGRGPFLYVLVEKRGLATLEAVGRIASALHLPRRRVGYAGLKDAQGVARQWLSLENVDREHIRQLRLDHIRWLKLDRHDAPLKRGDLAGNRFTLRLRKFKLPLAQAQARAEEIMVELVRRGVPNYFGPQRFGQQQNSHVLGEAIVRGDVDRFVDLFLGGPDVQDAPRIANARRYYQQRDYKRAYSAWPYAYGNQRRALKTLMQTHSSKQAYHVVDKRLKGLLVSAFQSRFFNETLAARMPYPDRLYAGDLAYQHTDSSLLTIEDPEKEQPRCDAFQISPTGPLPGLQMPRLAGRAGAVENPILDAAGLSPRDWEQMGHYGAIGTRRPLRFQPRDCRITAGFDFQGDYLELLFTLNPGCYATSLLREIIK